MSTKKIRCFWAVSDPLMQAYHDEEWGVPNFDSRSLWEMLMLEGFQAGLAWITVLRKRDAFRKAFHSFDPHAVARMGEKEIARQLENPGIIFKFVGPTIVYAWMQAVGLVNDHAEDCFRRDTCARKRRT